MEIEFNPRCDADCKFLAKDALSAVSVKGITYVLFPNECCMRPDSDGVITTIVSAVDGESFMSMYLVNQYLWLITNEGRILSVSTDTTHIALCEETNRRVRRTSSTPRGVALVFEGALHEVVTVEQATDNSLAVGQVIQIEKEITAMAFSDTLSAVCSRSTLQFTFGLQKRSEAIRDVTACICLESLVWVGTATGDVYVVGLEGVVELIPMHEASIISIRQIGTGQIWSWDANGKAVAWSNVEKQPLGSLNLSAKIDSLCVGPTYDQTLLCGVTQGEVVRWQLNEIMPVNGDSKLLAHLCDLLNAPDSVAIKSVTFNSFSPFSFQHDAAPYLIDAVCSLSSVRSLLASIFVQEGLSTSSLLEDVSLLAANARSAMTRNLESERLAASLCSLYGIPCPQDHQGVDMLLRVASILRERKEESIDAEPAADTAGYIYEKRIEALVKLEAKKANDIQSLTEQLQALKLEALNMERLFDSQEELIASQRASIEELQFQLSEASTQPHNELLLSELEAKNALIEELMTALSEKEREAAGSREQLERELDDITQNEVTLLTRIRAFQLQVAELKGGLRECEKGLRGDVRYDHIVRIIRPLVYQDKHAIDTIHAF